MAAQLNILVIEDEPAMRFMLSSALSDAGHSVEVIDTKDGAIAILTKRHKFDLILLDLNLGRDRGEDIFLYLIAKSIKYPPVIILSAQPLDMIKATADKISAADVLQKPASVSDVFRAVRRAGK